MPHEGLRRGARRPPSGSCAQDSRPPGPAASANPATDASDGATSQGTTSTGPAFCCVPEGEAKVEVTIGTGGPFELGIPWPRTDWCIRPEMWQTGVKGYTGTFNGEWRHQDERGEVLWMEGDGEASLVASIRTTAWSQCHDEPRPGAAWSIVTGLGHEGLEVFAGMERTWEGSGPDNVTVYDRAPTGPVRFTFVVQQSFDACLRVDTYEGVIEPGGWRQLDGRRTDNCPDVRFQ